MAKKTVIPTLGRHAANGQARVSIAGRHVYLGKHGSPEAEVKCRRLIAELKAARAVPLPSHGPGCVSTLDALNVASAQSHGLGLSVSERRRKSQLRSGERKCTFPSPG